MTNKLKKANQHRKNAYTNATITADNTNKDDTIVSIEYAALPF
jgi:hypothetical protein